MVALLLLLALSLFDPLFMQILRLKTNDLLLQLHLSDQGEIPVVIVDVDDESLGEIGQWPWPRTRVAEMIREIGEAGPKAIGLDIVFAEVDRSSPRQLVASLKEGDVTHQCSDDLLALPDHDEVLARSMDAVPVVLGFPFRFDEPARSSELSCSPSQAVVIGASPNEWLFAATSAVENLEPLQQIAGGNGFFNVLPDVDGVVRRVPLVIRHGEALYNSLVVEMLRVGEGENGIQIRANDNGMESLRVAGKVVPTNAGGQMLVRYLRAERPFPRYPAKDVLAGKVDSGLFAGAYVLVGTSAKGIQDFVTTPVADHYPGVGVHANAINTILTGEFLHQPDWAKGGELVYLLVVSLLLILLVPVLGAVRSGLLFLGVTLAVSYFSYWLFSRYGLFFDLTYPLLFSVLIFMLLTFINYALEESERSTIRKAFHRFLSPEVVAELLKSPGKLTLTGEEREVTALFSDIRGFSTIAEHLPPQGVCTFLNQYFSVIAQILMDNRATVDKFIGDAVYAFWNAPLADEFHTRNAMVAALEMRQGLDRLNGNWSVGDLPRVEAGIGINTGLAQVGNIGSERHLGYTAIGDTVNLASRLESITKVYGVSIIVSDSARKAVGEGEFVFRKLDLIQVVGREQPVLIYELIDRMEVVSKQQLDNLARYDSALEYYFSGDFSTALKGFEQLERSHYEKLYDLFIARCQYHMEHPPGAGWNGVSRYTSK